MAQSDEAEWKVYCANPMFRQYLKDCRDFDPVGIERALREDEMSMSFEFRRVIIDAYIEDCMTGAVRA